MHTVFINLPEGVRAAVISGEGSHFCAGLDLSELVARDIHSGVLHSRMWHAAFDAIQFGSVPVVAASTKARTLPGRAIACSTADQPPIDCATMRTSSSSR